jgi:hypothetical protein
MHPEPLPRKLPAESFLWADDESAGAAGAADSTSNNRFSHKTATKTESSSWAEGGDIGVVGAVDSTSNSNLNHQMATTKNFSWVEEEAEEEADSAVDGEWDTNSRMKTAMVASIAGRGADGRWNETVSPRVTKQISRGGQHGACACW